MLLKNLKMQFLNKKEDFENEEKGLNITIPLKLIGRVIGQAIFPVIIMLSLYITQQLFAGFWSEVLMVVGVTALAMFILHSKNVVRADDDVIQVLRDSLVIGTGSVLLTRIINHYAIGQNTFGSVPMVISILLVVFGLVLTRFSDPHDHYRNRAYEKACTIFAKIVSTLVTVWLLGSIYKVAGTQYIWLPAISLWIFWFYFSNDEDFEAKIAEREDILTVSALSLFAICLISTICQFWFSKIMFGFNLWQCLLGVFILAIVIVSLVFYKKHKDERLAKKISAEKEEVDKAKKIEADLKIKEENEKAAQDRSVKLDSFIKDIQTEDEQKWSQILFVSHWYKDNHQIYNIILRKIHLAPLEQLVEISKVKNKIVFNGSELDSALKLINNFAEKNNTDEVLQGFIDQLVEFLELIYKFSSFKGYQETVTVVKDVCSTVYQLIPKEKLEKIVAND